MVGANPLAKIWKHIRIDMKPKKKYNPNKIRFYGIVETDARRLAQQCSVCWGRVVMNGFSVGGCQICGDAIICAETPCVKLCWKCARKNNKCIVCGGDLY